MAEVPPTRSIGTDQTAVGGHDGAATDAAIDVPEVVGGRYRILGLIGSGGMGTVYRVRDLELDEIVALKIVRRHLGQRPEMLERFRHEVKLARRVTHANVARTFDIGDHAGEKFLTMEYVDGRSLANLRDAGVLPLARAVEIAEQLCAGLAAAHTAGVVHGDLKPDNVLVARDGRAVITDFGLASTYAEASAGGTPAYMAPEQVVGDAVDARADLYALGVMLFELATTQLPWRGETGGSVAAARLSRPPPDPRAFARDVPDALAEIILKLMALAPADRFPDARAVGVALASIDTLRASPKVTPRPTLGSKSVAVLPWRNLGAADDDDYLAGALTDNLIDRLTMARGLRVRARGGIAAGGDPRDAGRALGVDAVVDGTMRREGGRLHVSARLIAVADGFQLWAKRYDEPTPSILALIDDEAEAIAGVLTAESGAAPPAAPLDSETLELYLRARQHARRRSPDKRKEAIALYERALARSPDHPMLLAGYASTMIAEWFFGGSAAAAKQAAERAVALGPDRAEPHVALASVRLHSGDPASAIRELRSAIAIAPSLADAHELAGSIALEVGRIEDAIRSLEIAESLDPEIATTRSALARAYALLGKWERVDALDVAGASPVLSALRMRLALWRGGRAAVESMASTSRFDSPALTFVRSAIVEVVSTGSFDGPEIARLRSSAVRRDDAHRWQVFGLQIQVELAAFIGETSRAWTALVDAIDAGLIDLAWLERCPMLAPLRAQPGFASLRTRVCERVAPVLAALDA